MFSEKKTTQIAGYLLKQAGGKLNYTAFLKLLYMADKKMLVEWGVPITYDQWFSMPQGPVLSNTYNLIRRAEGVGYWGKHIRTSGYDIELLSDPENDLLSEAEEGAVDEIFSQHGGKDWRTLVHLTHGFAEWEDPQGSSSAMPYEKVLEVEGFSRDHIDEVVRNIDIETGIKASLLASGG